MMTSFTHETETEAPIETVFEWHERRGAFHRLTPPWELVLEKRADQEIHDVGYERIMKFVMGPAKMTWHAKHTLYDKPSAFGENMIKGKLWKWDNKNIFEEEKGIKNVKDKVE